MKIVIEIQGGCFVGAYTDDAPGTVELYIADWDNYEDPGDEPECQHKSTEDCMTCFLCGKCRESLDDNGICSACRSLSGFVWEEGFTPLQEAETEIKEALENLS